MFHEEFWLPWQQSKSSIINLQECFLDRGLPEFRSRKMIRQKTWLLWGTHFPLIMAESKMKVFRLVQGRLLVVNYSKVISSYFPLMLYVISSLKCIIHQSFGQLKLWMLISFIILFMIDLYKDNHVRACVRP